PACLRSPPASQRRCRGERSRSGPTAPRPSGACRCWRTPSRRSSSPPAPTPTPRPCSRRAPCSAPTCSASSSTRPTRSPCGSSSRTCCSPRSAAAPGPPSTGPRTTASTASEPTYQVEGSARWRELPEDADGGRVEAYFDDGAGSLEIKVPKRSSDAHQQA
uniref:SHSP domain-containing protein n=1 Tax=Aegilops tauschii subsp. strangulata TaxID=200361 RepID=A0A452ZGJ3_AEGTS